MLKSMPLAPTRCPYATRPEEPKINGRKRHIVVGTIGLILAVVVHWAGSKTATEPSLFWADLRGVSPACC